MEFIFENEEVEQEILVGYLNRKYGYTGYIISEIGTEVFEVNDNYYFYIIHEITGNKKKVSFYKENFKKHINFI